MYSRGTRRTCPIYIDLDVLTWNSTHMLHVSYIYRSRCTHVELDAHVLICFDRAVNRSDDNIFFGLVVVADLTTRPIAERGERGGRERGERRRERGGGSRSFVKSWNTISFGWFYSAEAALLSRTRCARAFPAPLFSWCCVPSSPPCHL